MMLSRCLEDLEQTESDAQYRESLGNRINERWGFVFVKSPKYTERSRNGVVIPPAFMINEGMFPDSREHDHGEE